MYSREALVELLRHMEWADARVWRAIDGISASDARLRRLLTHIHTVQHAFLVVWTAGDIAAVFAKEAALHSLADVRDWALAYYAVAHGFVDRTNERQLSQLVEMPWAAQLTEYLGHAPGATTMAETIFQVTSHSTYHRGQVNARLRELGVEPPLVDYIAWLWMGRPAPEWQA